MQKCKSCKSKVNLQQDTLGHYWCSLCLPKLHLMNYGKLNNFPEVQGIWQGEGAWAVTVSRMPLTQVHSILESLQSPSERQEPSLIDKEASLEVPTLESPQNAIVEVSGACCQCGAVATKHSPSLDEEGKPRWWYCEEHAHCNRCGKWEWKFNEELRVWLCVCFSESYYALGGHLKVTSEVKKPILWTEVKSQEVSKSRTVEVKQEGSGLFDIKPEMVQEVQEEKELCGCGEEATDYLGDGTPVCEKCLEKEEIA